MDEYPSANCTIDVDGMLSRLGGQRALVDQIFLIFKEDAPQLVEEVEQGLRVDDADQVKRSAHALKGLLANFGDVDCGFEITQVELFAKSGVLRLAAEHFERFKPKYAELLDSIDKV